MPKRTPRAKAKISDAAITVIGGLEALDAKRTPFRTKPAHTNHAYGVAKAIEMVAKKSRGGLNAVDLAAWAIFTHALHSDGLEGANKVVGHWLRNEYPQAREIQKAALEAESTPWEPPTPLERFTAIQNARALIAKNNISSPGGIVEFHLEQGASNLLDGVWHAQLVSKTDIRKIESWKKDIRLDAEKYGWPTAKIIHAYAISAGLNGFVKNHVLKSDLHPRDAFRVGYDSELRQIASPEDIQKNIEETESARDEAKGDNRKFYQGIIDGFKKDLEERNALVIRLSEEHLEEIKKAIDFVNDHKTKFSPEMYKLLRERLGEGLEEMQKSSR